MQPVAALDPTRMHCRLTADADIMCTTAPQRVLTALDCQAAAVAGHHQHYIQTFA